MKLIRDVFNTVLVIFIILIILFIVFVQLTAWIKLAPPASAVLTLPKMLITWFSWQSGILCLFLAFVTMCLWHFKREENHKTKRLLLSVIFSLLIISALNSFFIAYKMRTTPVLTNRAIPVNTTKFTNKYEGEIIEKNLEDKFKDIIPGIEYFTLYSPQSGKNNNICLLYLNYGNWKVHNDPGQFSYLRKHLNKRGYSYAVYGGRSRLDTDAAGLVRDIKKAIGYLKDPEYNFNIKKVILSGGSAGGHLALLAAFSADIPEYTNKGADDNLGKADAVLSFYSPIDMSFDYSYFTDKGGQDLSWMDRLGNKIYEKTMGYPSIKACHINSMDTLLGGNPDNKSYNYKIASVNKIAGKYSMPVLLVHGSHDSNSPVLSARKWAVSSIENGSNMTYLEIPHAEHVFDLVMPGFSPAVHRTLEVINNWLYVSL